ncbi:MAG: adenylyltransferase/cytidyltransferase family protein [Patescibacteria group bacterium]
MIHNSKFTRVLVFGVFDGLHEGHKFFLREAKKFGDFLVVSLAKDEATQKIKKRPPRHNFEERKKVLEKEMLVDEIIAGDSESGTWQIFEKVKPEVIALGYDQISLRESLEEYFSKSYWQLEIKNISSFSPEKYKSSLIQN